MGAAYFYHLTRAPLEATLPSLLARAMAQGDMLIFRWQSELHLNFATEFRLSITRIGSLAGEMRAACSIQSRHIVPEP